MRTILLSFKSEVYRKLLSGEKKYEHRKRFPDEPIEAYLYVSAPIKAVMGILHLSNRMDIAALKGELHNQQDINKIEEYLKKHRYAMEIVDFQDTNSISLKELRKVLPGFVVPQMYYYIDNSKLLDYLKENISLKGEKIVHSFSNFSIEEI